VSILNIGNHISKTVKIRRKHRERFLMVLSTLIFALLILNFIMNVDSISLSLTGDGTARSNGGIPSPHQIWSHCTITTAQLNDALTNDSITAIEADIMMDETGSFPVMAHPPSRESSLSFKGFFERIFVFNKERSSDDKKTKLVKLDFKEIEVVLPCLKNVASHNSDDVGQQHTQVYLNADILRGPGARTSDPVDGTKFAEAIKEEGGKLGKVFLSLGWKTHVARYYNSQGSYSSDDCAEMLELIQCE